MHLDKLFFQTDHTSLTRIFSYCFICLLYICISGFNCFAAEEPNDLVIPFNRAGNLILLKGKVDSIEGNFILDTGAPGLVLNITYFRHYPILADEERNGVTGAVNAAAQTIISHFSFEGRNFYKTPADLISLGHIEDIKGVRILGLIGMSFLRNTELIIDYEKSLLYIHFYNGKDKNSYKNEMLQNTNDYSTVPIEIIESKIVVYPTMAGRKMKFLIDTGAESNILDTRLPNKVFENVTITRRTNIAGTGNKKVEALYGDMKNMKMGKDDLGTLPVIITNLQNACISPMCCVDGMLGFDFLSLHKIGFNFAKQEMYIWK